MAVSLSKVEQSAPALVSLYKTAGASVERRGLSGQRFAVYLVVDYSGSMRPYYKDGSVQALADRVLGLSAHLDDDGSVPVVFFSTEVDAQAEIALADHEGWIDRIVAGLGHMGKTSYHLAMEAVVRHYRASGATDPALVLFQTDGGPISKPAAERGLCEAATLPIFWQFIGFGDPHSRQFDFLRKLTGLAVPEKRAIDNAGFVHLGRDPRTVSDRDLYDLLLADLPSWLEAARAQGIVPPGPALQPPAAAPTHGAESKRRGLWATLMAWLGGRRGA
ncbi:VWA domain-containing protein [Kitasatospora brasiliensis]|uniref:VWA domain-containing protein n=1 Tax=Kitasatospora brasiliensis TaxID=3058040 RepID=UPI0029301878|nr:VWA domain-containing protein [Kitasatospora sp. K002]